MNFFSTASRQAKRRKIAGAHAAMRSLAWFARYSIRVPEEVSACSNASAANAPGATKAGPHGGPHMCKQAQVAIRATSDRNGGRVTAF